MTATGRPRSVVLGPYRFEQHEQGWQVYEYPSNRVLSLHPDTFPHAVHAFTCRLAAKPEIVELLRAQHEMTQAMTEVVHVAGALNTDNDEEADW